MACAEKRLSAPGRTAIVVEASGIPSGAKGRQGQRAGDEGGEGTRTTGMDQLQSLIPVSIGAATRPKSIRLTYHHPETHSSDQGSTGRQGGKGPI